MAIAIVRASSSDCTITNMSAATTAHKLCALCELGKIASARLCVAAKCRPDTSICHIQQQTQRKHLRTRRALEMASYAEYSQYDVTPRSVSRILQTKMKACLCIAVAGGRVMGGGRCRRTFLASLLFVYHDSACYQHINTSVPTAHR